MSNTLNRIWMVMLVLSAIGFGVMAALPAQAQRGQSTGAIAGTVTDAHGHPIHRAHVTLENLHHQVLDTTSSDLHGEFEFHHVHPGHYTIKASKRHFGHGSTGVDVHGGHTANAHIVLQ